MIKYLINPTLITVLLAAGYFIGAGKWIPGGLHPLFPWLILFFYLQSFAVAWLFSEAEKTRWQSPLYALGAITFRLLTAMFFLVILFVSKPEQIKSLMIQFITLYLAYLIFELFALLPNLRRN